MTPLTLARWARPAPLAAAGAGLLALVVLVVVNRQAALALVGMFATTLIGATMAQWNKSLGPDEVGIVSGRWGPGRGRRN